MVLTLLKEHVDTKKLSHLQLCFTLQINNKFDFNDGTPAADTEGARCAQCGPAISMKWKYWQIFCCLKWH